MRSTTPRRAGRFGKPRGSTVNLAMAHWGEAMTLAVNLNAPMPAESGRLAYESVQRAQALAHSASPKERALIAALAMRLPRMGPRRGHRSIAPTPTR
jgi:hypothetical protein